MEDFAKEIKKELNELENLEQEYFEMEINNPVDDVKRRKEIEKKIEDKKSMIRNKF